jgi:hypothetical protein
LRGVRVRSTRQPDARNPPSPPRSPGRRPGSLPSATLRRNGTLPRLARQGDPRSLSREQRRP